MSHEPHGLKVREIWISKPKLGLLPECNARGWRQVHSYAIMLLKTITFTYVVPLYALSYGVFATTLNLCVSFLGKPVVKHFPACLWVGSSSGPRAHPPPPLPDLCFSDRIRVGHVTQRIQSDRSLGLLLEDQVVSTLTHTRPLDVREEARPPGARGGRLGTGREKTATDGRANTRRQSGAGLRLSSHAVTPGRAECARKVLEAFEAFGLQSLAISDSFTWSVSSLTTNPIVSACTRGLHLRRREPPLESGRRQTNRLPQEESTLPTTATGTREPAPACSLVIHAAPPAGPATGPFKMNG